MQVSVIGAGLAGCEAAWQLARRGIAVTLYEMKPAKRTPAHHIDDFAELCCSNSLRSDQLENAVGLLKEELRRLGSLILACADETRVPAGGALAVDRHGFSRLVTERVRSHPNITVIESEVTSIPAEGTVIVASGPLTSDALSAAIAEKLGDGHTLNFYDAAAPLVTYESVDMSSAWFASRYDKGTADYINCPLTAEEYDAFWHALTTAEEAPVHGFEDKHVFEGCMPVEVMARRGHDTLCYGPLKPRGLKDPKTGHEPYAVVQLRRDNAEGSIYNLVGFQTHLRFPEQKRVFSMIPALANAEFVRYGVMHRNTYLNSPGLLDRYYRGRPCFLCRADDRRGGLRRVRRVRLPCGRGDRAAAAGAGPHRLPARDRHRRAGAVCERHDGRQFPADERQLRHHAAARLPHQGKAQQERGALPPLAGDHRRPARERPRRRKGGKP